MTREELKERVSKLIQTLENVERSLQFTNIPVHAEHTPTSDAVKNAVQRYNEEKKKKQEQIIIDTLGAVDCIVSDLVDNLRRIRAEEKRAQQRILDVTAAKEAYLADPDQEVLVQELRKAGVCFARYTE